jgi:hypothetical protein
VVLGAAGLGLALAFACGFPDPAFVADADGGGPGGGDGEAGPDPAREDGGTEGGAITDAPGDTVVPPGDDADVIVDRGDATVVEPDAACKTSNLCDCDNDGYTSTACDAGTDCDDRDPLVHPNQTYVGTPPPREDGGDWDCSGQIDKQYAYDLRCDAIVSCNAAEGFANDPACGEPAPYIRCKPAISPLVGCAATDAGSRRQGCK